MKSVANGIYSQFPPLKRITAKIEKIIREEMDALDGQEVLFPVAEVLLRFRTVRHTFRKQRATLQAGQKKTYGFQAVNIQEDWLAELPAM